MLRQLLGNVLPYDHNSSSTSSNAQPLRSADNDEQRGSLLCSVFSDDEEELDGEDDGFDVDEIDGAFDEGFFFLAAENLQGQLSTFMQTSYELLPKLT